jgi:acyl-CoA thioesterase-2
MIRIESDGLLCQVTAGFAPATPGIAYQDAAPAAGLPAPESLPSTHAQARAEGWSSYANGPLEFRRAHPRVWPDPQGDHAGGHVEWLRPRTALPDDPRLQMAALVFLGDFYSHWPFERRIGPGFAQDRFRPLDFSLAVHRPPRWDDWWLLESTSEIAHGGCALARRRIFTRDGALLASAAQTALVAG